MDFASRWIVLAQILRPQGRRGEVLADLFTDFPDRFDKHPGVWLAPSGYAEREEKFSASAGTPAALPATLPAAPSAALPAANNGAAPESAVVVAHWLPVGKNAGRIVLEFVGVDTIEKAELLAGKEVLIPLADRLPLDDGAAYISDLVGCTVYDHGHPLGVVESVQFPTAPDGNRRLEDAAPLLTVTSPQGDEILVPFVAAFLRELDAAARSIRMDLPEGLAEINQPGINQPRPKQTGTNQPGRTSTTD